MATGPGRQSKQASSVPVPAGFAIRPGLHASEARKAYRRRVLGELLILLVLTATFWLASLGELKYAVRSFSFVHTTGTLVNDPYSLNPPSLAIEFTDTSGQLEYADLDTSAVDAAHVGAHVPIWYDGQGICPDILYGRSDWVLGITFDLIIFVSVPILAGLWLAHRGRRWWRQVERAASRPPESGCHVEADQTMTRRPVVAVTDVHSGRVLYLPLLSRQLARVVADFPSLEVHGHPVAGGTIVLRQPDSPLTIWPAGRLRQARWIVDRYDLERIAAIVGPQILAWVYHLATSPHSC